MAKKGQKWSKMVKNGYFWGFWGQKGSFWGQKDLKKGSKSGKFGLIFLYLERKKSEKIGFFRVFRHIGSSIFLFEENYLLFFFSLREKLFFIFSQEKM